MEEVKSSIDNEKSSFLYTIILMSFIIFAFSTCNDEKITQNPTADPCKGDLQDKGPMIFSYSIVPENGAVDVPTSFVVSWIGGSRHPATTSIYLGKSPDDMKIIYSETTQFNQLSLGELEFNTKYYWKVTIIEKTCGRGAETGTLSFTTIKQ